MVRLLHTADVHLAADRPERQAGLEAVLDLAAQEAVDLVTIGGDLFDSEIDSEELRPELRQGFADLPYDVLTIPGNHDAEAFRSDLHYGAAFTAAVTEPFEHVTIGDVRITCVPYTAEAVEDVLLALAERDPHAGPEIVMLHCSLDAPFQDASTGDEAGHRYFPVTRETLADLGFDYYLAGHFHSAHRVALPNDAPFMYPGTPASVTRAETGPRSVAIVDTDVDSVQFHRLDTFHYDTLEMTVTPGEEDAALERIAEWVEPRQDRTVEAMIEVTGHVATDETAFHERLMEVSGDIPVRNETTGVADVLAHPLFQAFETELEARTFDDADLEDEVWERTVRIFSELSAGGRLQ